MGFCIIESSFLKPSPGAFVETREREDEAHSIKNKGKFHKPGTLGVRVVLLMAFAAGLGIC
jgi:hypothetical protein